MTFTNYEYKILFRQTHKHSNADTLSRQPSPTLSAEEPVPTELILLMEAMDKMAIIGEKVSKIGHKRIQPYLNLQVYTKWLSKSVSRRKSLQSKLSYCGMSNGSHSMLVFH